MLMGLYLLVLGCAAPPEKVHTDLDKLCEFATAADQAIGKTTKERARDVAYQFKEIEPSKESLAITERIAKTAPEKRYEALLSEAKSHGYADFECPALQRMLNPPPDPPAEGAEAQKEAPKDPWW